MEHTWLFTCIYAAAVTSAFAMAQEVAPSNEPPVHSVTSLIEGSGFVKIPAGEFVMGSKEGSEDEQPAHKVRITRSFEMGKYEVTQMQWDTVMRNPHARPKAGEKIDDVNPSNFKGPSLPVESVSWDAVQQFLAAMNLRDPAHIYRLPTEAEWEYAARAGKTSSRAMVDDEAAWCEAVSEGKTHPVGEKTPNAWGLYDMLGNVFEWVQDWYGTYLKTSGGIPNPKGPPTGSYKVYRGGAWLSAYKQCQTTFRGFDFPNSGYYSVGFRLVRTANKP